MNHTLGCGQCAILQRGRARALRGGSGHCRRGLWRRCRCDRSAGPHVLPPAAGIELCRRRLSGLHRRHRVRGLAQAWPVRPVDIGDLWYGTGGALRGGCGQGAWRPRGGAGSASRTAGDGPHARGRRGHRRVCSAVRRRRTLLTTAAGSNWRWKRADRRPARATPSTRYGPKGKRPLWA